jgi:23S rRNA (guanosine2251-2'-O)-methyltransferase
MDTFYVDGVPAISEYLRFRRNDVIEVECRPDLVASVKERLAEFNVSLTPMAAPKDQTQNAGVRARVKHELKDFSLIESKEAYSDRETILALDHISDPRNLGAIVRSAAFFGVSKILVPERRQTLLTQAAVSTAQGGFALTDLYLIVNLARSLERLKDLGFWIIGADMAGSSAKSVVGKFERQVLVLGSEGDGLGRNIKEKCDILVKIQGASKSLESLNVSVAGGILLHELCIR